MYDWGNFVLLKYSVVLVNKNIVDGYSPAPLCTVVNKSSPPVLRTALLYASCSSWDKIFGSSARASKHDVLIVSLGTMNSGISNLS